MNEGTIGYYSANYVVRDLDTSTILHALGTVWAKSLSDEIAQDAANLYYRLKGSFATNMYRRESN